MNGVERTPVELDALALAAGLTVVATHPAGERRHRATVDLTAAKAEHLNIWETAR
jgi:hypothetical protein